MDIASALKRQHRLGLEMLRDCVQQCPDDLWNSGTEPRVFWRIAYHAAYYTDRYLQKDARSFRPRVGYVKDIQALWGQPPQKPVYSKQEVLEYVSDLLARVEPAIEALDLEAADSGFGLYKMPKVDLLILNLRHLQHHVGQLSELLMARGINIEWAGMS